MLAPPGSGDSSPAKSCSGFSEQENPERNLRKLKNFADVSHDGEGGWLGQAPS